MARRRLGELIGGDAGRLLIDEVNSWMTDQKIRNGWSKYVLRIAFPELPAAIRWRRDKQGFILPEAQWLRHDLAGEVP